MRSGKALATVLACTALALLHGQQPPRVTPLPAWTAGTLDIHQIDTGRGNSAFVIFPDGTTLLIDAGAAGDGIPYTDPRPDASRTPGGWIVRYIKRMAPPDNPALDYAFLTHFHADHIGQVVATSTMSRSGAYKLTGITEIAEAIPIGTLIDRGWPDYSVVPPSAKDSTFANYRAFLEYQQAHGRLRIDGVRVGRSDQITLRRSPATYPGFEVRSVVGNGVVWTGTGDSVIHAFPPLAGLAAEDRPSENMCSAGLRIRYGRFDYFTGGDIYGIPDAGAPEWQDLETPVARAIGPTDVHVVSQHGSISEENVFFLKTLRSRVIILPSWSPTHPSQDVLKRILAVRLYGPRDVFATILREPTKVTIGARVDQLKATEGHIVVRVDPGGATYRVYVLDDLREDCPVKVVFGPYESE